MEYDLIVVGAGFSGSVIAERISATTEKKVLVIEIRDHIGGNCFDYKDKNGIIIHKYGPHLFHTNKAHVWKYLSRFTAWHPYEHKVLANVDNKLVPLPFNLNTLREMYEEPQAELLKRKLIERFGYGTRVAITELKQDSDVQLKQLGKLVFEKFFLNYTTKQWGCAPHEISQEVLSRVPVVISHDDRYFHDKYQFMPVDGYTSIFEKMLSSNNIDVLLSTNALDLLSLDKTNKTIYFNGKVFKGHLVFTGTVDSLFGYSEGELPYRSLQFEFTELGRDRFQPATTVNYPNTNEYTRITEFKNIYSNDSVRTTIVKEYPQDYDRNNAEKNIPYYPILNQANKDTYEKYKQICSLFPQMTLTGRLAEYRYYNMDDVIDKALRVANDLVDSSL